MPKRPQGVIEPELEIRVELVGSGPAGPPGDTPYIGTDENWWIGGENTGVKARGTTPEIKNGSWWIGGEDTGVSVSGCAALERITNSELEELLK